MEEVGVLLGSVRQHKATLKSAVLTDYTIYARGQAFKCHRVFLAARSQVWKDHFIQHPDQISSSVDIHPIVIQCLLEFIYTDTIKIPTKWDEVGSLMETSGLWGVEIHSFLTNKFSPSSTKATICFTTIEQDLSRFRKEHEGMFSDIVLVDCHSLARYPAHRCILVTHSEYFRSMFCAGWKEAGEESKEIWLEQICPLVIDFLYHGKSILQSLEVEQLLELSEYGQYFVMEELIDHIENLLIERLSPDNLVSLWTASRIHTLSGLEKAAVDCLVQNFEGFSGTEEFLQVDKSLLVALLNTGELPCAFEFIYEALLKWGKNQEQEDTKRAEELIGDLMPPRVLFNREIKTLLLCPLQPCGDNLVQ